MTFSFAMNFLSSKYFSVLLLYDCKVVLYTSLKSFKTFFNCSLNPIQTMFYWTTCKSSLSYLFPFHKKKSDFFFYLVRFKISQLSSFPPLSFKKFIKLATNNIQHCQVKLNTKSYLQNQLLLQNFAAKCPESMVLSVIFYLILQWKLHIFHHFMRVRAKHNVMSTNFCLFVTVCQL